MPHKITTAFLEVSLRFVVNTFRFCIVLMDGWMDEWMNGWMDGWMNEWMDGWMTRQTDTC